MERQFLRNEEAIELELVQRRDDQHEHDRAELHDSKRETLGARCCRGRGEWLFLNDLAADDGHGPVTIEKPASLPGSPSSHDMGTI